MTFVLSGFTPITITSCAASKRKSDGITQKIRCCGRIDALQSRIGRLQIRDLPYKLPWLPGSMQVSKDTNSEPKTEAGFSPSVP